MFARVLTVSLKPGQAAGYAASVDGEIVPMMKTFAGFRDEMTMISPDGRQVLAMSIWNSPEDADVYKRDGYPKVLKTLEPFFETKPVVVTYNLALSTAHGIKAGTAGAAAR